MDYAQLTTNLNNLGVIPRDILRASLYYNHLDAAHTFFTVTMNAPLAPPGPGLGVGYAFVQNAVSAPALLNELAEILDFFVAPAVDADLQRAYAPPPNGLGHGGGVGWTYRDYFDNEILDPLLAAYNNNVAAFMARYPITDHALNRLSANFQNNILEACQRVIADKVLLTNFYTDLYSNNLVINSLDRIKSTGSDFHKGGKQVLILTFDITHKPGLLQKREDLKVVYKPSDIEVDCLIVGDSVAINNVIPGFMVNSLFEIYNNRLQLYKTANPDFTGESLDTYRLLPRNYISAHLGGYPLPIRQAYGYIQYLDNELTGTAQQVFGYYPLGKSDYLIFKGMNETEIVRKFYRKEGAYSALACNFSLMDMHIENMRVKNYAPYPIDLEVSLTSMVNSIDDTVLIGNTGGITGVKIQGQDSHWVVQNANTPGGASVQRDYPDVYYQNRLWRWRLNRNKQLIPVDQYWLLQGYLHGMRILREGEQNGDFNVWFARLNNVLVRYIPYPTSVFKSIITQIFMHTVQGHAPGAPPAPFGPTMQEILRNQLTGEYNNYVLGQDPKFLAFTQAHSGPDYQNLDIPVFYHRIGSQEIVNSQGIQVTIPATVTIDNPAAPPPTINAPVAVGRATFFANQLTQINVEQGQVQILGLVGYPARVVLIQGTITAGLAGPFPNVIVPINT